MSPPFDRTRDNYAQLGYGVDQRNFTFGMYYPGGGYLGSQQILGRSLPWPNYHLMIDQVEKVPTRDNTSGYYPSGKCFHVSVDLSKLGLESDFSGWGPGPDRFDIDGRPFCTLHGHDQSMEKLGIYGASALGYPYHFNGRLSDSIRNDLNEQAFNYFSDIFPEAISFSEFLQGFTQLKDLIPKVEESITKTLSGGYLNKSFGWDNLLPDLETLGNMCSIVTERMEYFHRTFNVPTRLGFSRKDVHEYNLDDLSGSIYDSNYQTKRIRCVKASVDFRATAWIRQHLDFMHDLAGFIRVLIGALGLNNPIKAFWNTVPLSFVVDWFFDTSQHLDNLTRLNPPMGWDMLNMTNSLTYTFEWEVEQFNLYDHSGGTPLVSYPAKTIIYDREVGLSFGWQLLNPADLSPTQLTLLLAMLHQLG